MLHRFLTVGAAALALCFGCNPPANQSEPAAEEAHDDHGHDHDHDHGDHGDHDHAEDGHADHDHEEHAHSATYEEALTKIAAARDTIRDRLAEGKTEEADAALHELGHELEHVSELTGEMADDVRADIKKDADELLDLFGTVDEQIHSGVEVTYDTVSEKIDAVIERMHERAYAAQGTQ